MMSKENELEESWRANAPAWTAAVREQHIESRRLATDRAIVEAILEHEPERMLDVGCGEGWLARAVAARGVDVVGFDGSAELIARARELGGGTFTQLRYEEFAAQPRLVGKGFDAVVANFALLGQELSPLLRACRTVLADGGRLFIQTVHPLSALGADEPYRDGWREESFSSLGEGFRSAMPWYFRTFSSWLTELKQSGFDIDDVREPSHPETRRPLSLLFIARAAGE